MRPVAAILRTLGHVAAAAGAPSTPTLSVVNDGDGDAVTATVAGDDGVTNRLFYRKTSASAWTEGESRSGDGEIAQAGLDDGSRYEFIVQSEDGEYYSRPSAPAFATVASTSGVSASAAISLPLENLRTLVAASANFQAWVGAGDASEAKEHVYRVAADSPFSSKRPFALVRNADPGEVEHASEAGGAAQYFVESGALELYFEDAVAEANQDSHADAELAFLNTVGAIMGDMEALAGSGTYLTMTGWQILAGPTRSHPDETESGGDFYQVLLKVTWGV